MKSIESVTDMYIPLPDPSYKIVSLSTTRRDVVVNLSVEVVVGLSVVVVGGLTVDVVVIRSVAIVEFLSLVRSCIGIFIAL